MKFINTFFYILKSSHPLLKLSIFPQPLLYGPARRLDTGNTMFLARLKCPKISFSVLVLVHAVAGPLVILELTLIIFAVRKGKFANSVPFAFLIFALVDHPIVVSADSDAIFEIIFPPAHIRALSVAIDHDTLAMQGFPPSLLLILAGVGMTPATSMRRLLMTFSAFTIFGLLKIEGVDVMLDRDEHTLLSVVLRVIRI